MATEVNVEKKQKMKETHKKIIALLLKILGYCFIVGIVGGVISLFPLIGGNKKIALIIYLISMGPACLCMLVILFFVIRSAILKLD